MSWSPRLSKLFVQGDITELQAYTRRLEAEIGHNAHRPKRAGRLQELADSANLMVDAIQGEASRMAAEDETHGPTMYLLGGLARR